MLSEVAATTADWLSRLLPCGSCSGSEGLARNLKLRSSAVGLRTARAHCAHLRKRAPSSAPLAHLRAAEQHLAAVERWLLEDAHVKKKTDWAGSLERLEAESLAELALEFGQRSEEEEGSFTSLFSTVDAEERLLAKISCSVLASAFFYQGFLYLSSERLCFYSCIMGVETSFTVSWRHLKSLLLMPSQGSDSKYGIRGHRVRATLKEVTAFAGEDVTRLDLRLFDPKALGYIHKCATYFTGLGLFDYATLKSRASSMRSLSVDSASPLKRYLTMDENSTDVRTVEDLEKQMAVWEVQRRPTIFSSRWLSPYLPHDWRKRCKWVSLQDKYMPHPSLPEGMSFWQAAASDTPPITEVQILGDTRACTWNLVTDDNTDEDGWQYSVDFYVQERLWTPKLRCWSQVRRRRWLPDCVALKEELDDSEGSDLEGSDLDRLFESMPSTILGQKGLSEQAGGSAKQLFDIDLGEVTLEALGEQLLEDDWQSPGSLMISFFNETGAYDVQVGPWAGGAAVEKVKGKIRSVEMRVPVPPAPMCPKETRCAATWHVAVDASHVVLESVNMSLDVPYGDCFNVVACDTFKICESTGRMRMVRTCAVDWVKSTWMKSLVEANVPTEVTKAGERVAEVIKRHMAPGAGPQPPAQPPTQPP